MERLTAVTDRSATGISEERPRASPLTPEAVATPHHAPPLVRAGLGAQIKPSQAKSSQVKLSQVKSSRAPRAAAGAHTCATRAGRGAPAIARRMKQTPAADAHRGAHPRPGASLNGAAHGTGIPGARTHGRGAARSQVQSRLVFKNTGF